jgi:hypothetical protein
VASAGIERLVEVDHQRDIWPEQGAHALDHAFVIGGVAIAALDLDAAKALLQRTAQRLSSARDRPRRSCHRP